MAIMACPAPPALLVMFLYCLQCCVWPKRRVLSYHDVLANALDATCCIHAARTLSIEYLLRLKVRITMQRLLSAASAPYNSGCDSQPRSNNGACMWAATVATATGLSTLALVFLMQSPGGIPSATAGYASVATSHPLVATSLAGHTQVPPQGPIRAQAPRSPFPDPEAHKPQDAPVAAASTNAGVQAAPQVRLWMAPLLALVSGLATYLVKARPLSPEAVPLTTVKIQRPIAMASATAEKPAPAPSAVKKGKRVLVVGPTGYIGKYVTMQLIQEGYDVVAMSRPKSGIGGNKSEADVQVFGLWVPWLRHCSEQCCSGHLAFVQDTVHLSRRRQSWTKGLSCTSCAVLSALEDRAKEYEAKEYE